MGRNWKTDEHGFLQNDANADLIQPAFTGLLRDVVTAYEKHAGEALHSVYVTGDIARGVALPGSAELYVFAVYEPSVDPEALDETWLDVETMRMRDAHSGALRDVLLETWAYAYVFEEPEHFSPGAFTIKTESVCLWGNDLAPELPDYNLKKDSVRRAIANDAIVQIADDVADVEEDVQQGTSPEAVADACQWISQRMLRTGWSLATHDQVIHSRDLDLVVAAFSARYPEHAAHIQQAWDYTQHPTSDPGELLAFVADFGAWLIEQAGHWLDQHNPDRHFAFEFDEDDLLE